MKTKPRFHLLSRSLSARVLWLTVGIILLVEIGILMPSLGRERQTWLADRVMQAHLAAYSVDVSGHDGRTSALDQATRASLLRLSGTESISMVAPGYTIMVLPPDSPAPPDATDNIASDNLAISMWRADLAVLGFGSKRIAVTAPDRMANGMALQLVVDGQALAQHLIVYTAHIAALSVMIALVTGLLVFAALDRLLVRPMRIMTASIVGFRQDPERTGVSDLRWLTKRRDDEISEAARELSVMQDELRAALWRNARLAALGTAVAKISHDLRNILSSALLVADRLQETDDPAAQRAARTLIPAVERAAELVSRTVDFAREGPPAISRSRVVLRDLVDEVAGAIRPGESEVAIRNDVPDSVVLPLDRAQIYRVLMNLLRNAVEAGAKKIMLTAEEENGLVSLLVEDDGPGLPEKVKQNLFKPFTGSGRRGGTGLGLAIARDLVRAHGGDLVVRRTDQWGTVFVMGLATSDVPQTPAPMMDTMAVAAPMLRAEAQSGNA